MATPLNTIKNWFKTGLKPTQTQFWAMFDSFWHKAEEIPTSSINGLDGTLDNKVDKASYDIEQQEIADALVTIGEDVTGKVDKVDGKGLSTNDFTNEYKEIINQFNESLLVTSIDRDASFTISSDMHNETVSCSSESEILVSIPTNDAQNIPIGTFITFERLGFGEVIFNGAGLTIILEDGFTAAIRSIYTVVTLRKVDLNTWLLFGAIKPA